MRLQMTGLWPDEIVMPDAPYASNKDGGYSEEDDSWYSMSRGSVPMRCLALVNQWKH